MGWHVPLSSHNKILCLSTLYSFYTNIYTIKIINGFWYFAFGFAMAFPFCCFFPGFPSFFNFCSFSLGFSSSCIFHVLTTMHAYIYVYISKPTQISEIKQDLKRKQNLERERESVLIWKRSACFLFMGFLIKGTWVIFPFLCHEFGQVGGSKKLYWEYNQNNIQCGR